MKEFTKDGRQVIGKNIETTTLSEYIDGYWHVTQTVSQSRLLDGDDEWETKAVKMTAKAEDLNVAVANAFLSIETWLHRHQNDLFDEPVYPVPEKTTDGEYVN